MPEMPLVLSHMHGFNVSQAGLSLAYVTSSFNNVSGGISCPTVQIGDLIVFTEVIDDAASPGPSDVYPSGFTAIWTEVDLTPNWTRRSSSYKIAVGGEGGNNLNGADGDSANRHMVAVFRGTPRITSVTVGGVNSELNQGDPAQQVVMAAAVAAPLLIFAVYSSSLAIATPVFTPTEDGEIAAATNFFARYKVYNEAPANTTVNMEDAGAGNMLASWYMAVS